MKNNIGKFEVHVDIPPLQALNLPPLECMKSLRRPLSHLGRGLQYLLCLLCCYVASQCDHTHTSTAVCNDPSYNNKESDLNVVLF